MKKKSTPTDVQADGTWKGKKDTLMYKFEITMANGDTGQYSSPKYTDMTAQDFPFVVGVERDYEFEDGQYPKIKLPKTDFKPSGGYNDGIDPMYKQTMIVKQNALGHATELLKNNSAYATEPGMIKSDDVIALADKYTEFVMKPLVQPKPDATAELMDEDKN